MRDVLNRLASNVTETELTKGSASMSESYRSDITAELPMSRRAYLIQSAILNGAGIFDALEAVSSVALAHPEIDMAELATWQEWESMR